LLTKDAIMDNWSRFNEKTSCQENVDSSVDKEAAQGRVKARTQ
jgi:hypothetical protein